MNISFTKEFSMKNLKSILILVVIVLGLPILLAGCFNQQKNPNELVAGTCAGFPPYEVMDDNGNVVGFDIDVATEIAKALNKKIKIVDMSFEALVIALKQGKIDLILAGMSIIDSKKQAIEMVHYVGDTLKELPLVFWKKLPDGVTSVNDLAKLGCPTVCAQVATIQDEIFSKLPFLYVKHLVNIPDLIMDIKTGGSVAAVLEPLVVDELQKELPELKVLNYSLTPQDQIFGMGIGVKKENVALVQEIKATVATLKNNGTMALLEKKWFKKIVTSGGDK